MNSPVIFDTLLLKNVFKYTFLDKITDIGNDFLFSSYYLVM